MAKRPVEILSVFFAAGACAIASAGCKEKPPTSEPAAESTTATAASTPKQTLTLWWAQWAPADGLQELASAFAQKENVDVKVHQIP